MRKSPCGPSLRRARIRVPRRRWRKLGLVDVYAVKANPDPDIVKNIYDQGGSFDVASFPEFQLVHRVIEHLDDAARQAFIWDKIIYANTIKQDETLRRLDPYKPLVTYDNTEEIGKIRRNCPHAGLVLRVRVPNTGSMVELSSKFGADPARAVDLIQKALEAGLNVEGLSFHVGSQCRNFENYVQALQTAAAVFAESKQRGHALQLLDIGGGFPVRYHDQVTAFESLAHILNSEIDRLFPPEVEVIAEPGRFMVATAVTLVAKVIGKATRDGKLCYYIDDGVTAPSRASSSTTASTRSAP